MFLPVFNRDITEETLAEKHERIAKQFGIRIIETSTDSSLYTKGLPDPDLKVFIKNREIPNLIGFTCTITLVDEKYFIICDSTPLKNVHAYDLDGNWLWDIESCLNPKGKPVDYFFGVSSVMTDKSGTRQLLVDCYPVTYVTELATGKNTKIYEIEDISNLR